MDSIYLNGQELPLNNKPRSYAHIEESVDVSPGCLLTATEDCASNPCQNGGICNLSPTGGKLHNVIIFQRYTCMHLRGSGPNIFVFPLFIQIILSDTMSVLELSGMCYMRAE